MVLFADTGGKCEKFPLKDSNRAHLPSPPQLRGVGDIKHNIISEKAVAQEFNLTSDIILLRSETVCERVSIKLWPLLQFGKSEKSEKAIEGRGTQIPYMHVYTERIRNVKPRGFNQY